jgi:hypothetical protein
MGVVVMKLDEGDRVASVDTIPAADNEPEADTED